MRDKFLGNSLDFFMNHLQVFCKQHVLWELKAMFTHQDLTVRSGWMRPYLSHTCNLLCPLAWPPSALIYENDSSLKSFLALPGGCRSFCTGLVQAEVINFSMEGIQRDLILNIRGKKMCTLCTHLKRQVKIQTVKKKFQFGNTENFKKGMAGKLGFLLRPWWIFVYDQTIFKAIRCHYFCFLLYVCVLVVFFFPMENKEYKIIHF